MNETKTKEQFQELTQLIDSFFTRKTEGEGKVLFKENRDQLLNSFSSIPLEVLQNFPAYGAMGFLGKFQFEDCPETKALNTQSSASMLEGIRAKKAVKLAESARPAWDFLLKADSEVACAILALCYKAHNNKTITNRL